MRQYIYDRLRRLTPRRVRGWIKSSPLFVPVSKLVFGNDVYSDSYYEDVERIEAESVVHIADWIAANLEPERAIDVGCGPGHLMQQLRERGVAVYGVDLSPAALRRVEHKGLPHERFDLTTDGTPLPGGPYDLAISCEVAEHLDAKFARVFVEKLTAAAPRVYLTAAEPDPSEGIGLYHVNEQPNDYWIALMRERGFELDDRSTASARETLGSKPVISYLQRPMIFERA